METNLPQWSGRFDVVRPPQDLDFSDLLQLVTHHYRLHVDAVEFLGPYNAKQRGSIGRTYLPPSREQLKAAIRQGGVNDFSYQAFISSLERFCIQTKGQRALPTPHPSVLHSIQLPLPAFELSQVDPQTTIIKVIGVSVPLIVKGLIKSPETVKFVILRPKLSKLGTASAKNWEVLLFRQPVGYIPEWADTNLNPRYAGVYH